jgi:NADH dehydrogenase FAD-containing subunit
VTESAAARRRILILGGGFAGAYAHDALRQRLSGREDVRRVETVGLGPAGSR